jgi:hypothetical protein
MTRVTSKPSCAGSICANEQSSQDGAAVPLIVASCDVNRCSDEDVTTVGRSVDGAQANK